MSEMEIFMELLDERMMNFILKEFFSDNNPKQNERIRRVRLQKLLRDPRLGNLKKIYRMKGESCLQIVKRHLADKDLLGCDIDSLIGIILSEEKSSLSNLELFCTISIKFPEIIEEHIDIIMQNNKNNEFLLKGIEEFKLPIDNEESRELKKLQKCINELRKEIEKIRVESEGIKKENNRLSIEKNEILNENKKIKKDIKKIDRERITANNVNENLKELNGNYLSDLNKKNTCIEKLRNECEKIKQEKEDIYCKYKELKNKEFIENDPMLEFIQYKACLIYTVPVVAIRSIFKNILFVSYEEYLSDTDRFINNLNALGIKDVYIMSNNMSMREIGILKRKIRNENIKYNTLLFSNELNMVRELVESIYKEDEYEFIYT